MTIFQLLKVLKAFCETTTEPQNIFFELRIYVAIKESQNVDFGFSAYKVFLCSLLSLLCYFICDYILFMSLVSGVR